MAAPRICSIPDCGKPVKGRGWCGAHWERWRAHGDPLGGQTVRGEPLRYYREVVLVYDGDDCLFWPFARSGSGQGYAHLKVDGKVKKVHRMLCEETRGPAPTPEHQAAHSCGKGHLGCVTKRHLDWKTPKQNQADSLIHGTRTRGARTGTAKLTEDDVLEIRRRAACTNQQAIADEYGVTQVTISKIVRRERWGWLP